MNHTDFDNFTNGTDLPIPPGRTPKYPGWNIIEVFGLPGYRFYLIHLTGLVVLSISIITSLAVLLYLNCTRKGNFFSQSIDNQCKAFGFFLNEFILAQSIIVCFTAVNALFMVGFGKRIRLGKYDWKLTLTAFGIPGVFGIVAVCLDLFGPTGPWCYVDLRNPWGPAVSNTISMIITSVFLINLICYVAVLAKIRSVERKLENGKTHGGQVGSRARSAKIGVSANSSLGTTNEGLPQETGSTAASTTGVSREIPVTGTTNEDASILATETKPGGETTTATGIANSGVDGAGLVPNQKPASQLSTTLKPNKTSAAASGMNHAAGSRNTGETIGVTASGNAKGASVRSKHPASSTKYHNTAKIMMLFVFVYITQYWSLATFGVWSLFGEPSIVIAWGTVFFTNIGGVLNMLAYTVVRRRQRMVKAAGGEDTLTATLA